MTPPENLTGLPHEAGAGDREAFDETFRLVYGELYGLAHAQLRRELEGHTLNTGALVHEAYLRLGRGPASEWHDPSHFLAIAATVMRRILVDHARRFGADKRGGTNHTLSLDAVDLPLGESCDTLLVDLDDALTRLAALDVRQARVVECRFFGGLTEEETAGVLGVGLRTVKRDWAKARSWLYRELDPGGARE